jgi:hypothetical protein
MRVVAEAKENPLLTLGRTCQGQKGVNELGLKLGIWSLRVEFAIICAISKCTKVNLFAGRGSRLLQVARYGRGQHKMTLSHRGCVTKRARDTCW